MFKKKTAFFTTVLLLLAFFLLGPTVLRHLKQKQAFVPVRFLVVRNLEGGNLTLPGHWVADSLKVGDEELSPSGKVLARLTAIKQYEDGYNKVALLDVDILSSRDPLTGRYLFRQKDLLVGSTVELRLGRVLVFGEAISLPNEGGQSDREIIVTGYLYNQRDWLVNAITVGDTMSSGKNKEMVAKILSKQVYPANTEYRVNEGFVLGRASSRYRDVSVTFSLKVEEKDGNYVFASLQPVKINNILDLPFDKYNLYDMSVVSFKEVTSGK